MVDTGSEAGLNVGVCVPFAGVRHDVPGAACGGVGVLRAAVAGADVDAMVMWWASYVPTVHLWGLVDRLGSGTDPLDVPRLVAVSRGVVDLWVPRPGVVRSRRVGARGVDMVGCAFVACRGGAWMWACGECHAVEGAGVRRESGGGAAFVCARCGHRWRTWRAERVARAHRL